MFGMLLLVSVASLVAQEATVTPGPVEVRIVEYGSPWDYVKLEILGQLGDLFTETIDVSISISAASIPGGLPVGAVQFFGGERDRRRDQPRLGGCFPPRAGS